MLLERYAEDGEYAINNISEVPNVHRVCTSTLRGPWDGVLCLMIILFMLDSSVASLFFPIVINTYAGHPPGLDQGKSAEETHYLHKLDRVVEHFVVMILVGEDLNFSKDLKISRGRVKLLALASIKISFRRYSGRPKMLMKRTFEQAVVKSSIARGVDSDRVISSLESRNLAVSCHRRW